MIPLDLSLTNALLWMVQVAILTCAGVLFERTLKHSPSGRLWLWHTILVLALLAPWFSFQRENVPAPVIVAAVTQPVVVHPNASQWQWSWRDLLIGALLAGTVVRLLSISAGLFKLRRLRQSAISIDAPAEAILLESHLGISARYYVSELTGPVTYGWLRPVILLPANFAAQPANNRRAMLAHELLHVARRDWIIVVFEEGVRSALWFHPAIWWMLARAQFAREQTVDRLAIQLTADRDSYLETLLSAAQAQVVPDLGPAPLFSGRTHLARRVHSLLEEVSMSAPLLRRRLIAALTGAALTAVVIVLLFPLRIPAQAIAPGIERAASAFKVISMGPVIYPSSEDKGELNIEVTVNEKGEVTDARVLSGPEALRSAALRNVLSWKFATQPPLPPRFEVGLRFNERPKAAKSSESALINGSISRTQVVKKVLPKYPLAAKSAGVQGVVKLRVTINTEGLPKMVEVVSGPVELVEAARDAVLLWEWKPFEKEGARVEVITDVDINFTLADKAPAPPPPAN